MSNYSTQVSRGTLTEQVDQEQRNLITNKLTSINNQNFAIRDALAFFKSMQTQPGHETQMRNQEHAELYRQYQKHNNNFRVQTEKFANAVQ